jgi:formylglycine-generating enzyme required for sulfatase activity
MTTETPAAAQVTATPAISAEAMSLPGKRSSWKVWSLVCFLLIVLGGGGVIGWHVLTKRKLGDTRVWHVLTKRKLGDTRVNPIDKAEIVWVPGGAFIMGSIDGVGSDAERPAHQVTLSGYWIYKYEVTVAQYLAFCAATGRALPEFPSGYSWTDKSGWTDPALRQHPIVDVGWNDAKAYADWAKVALPTEAQWEYAARGPEGRNYPWGGTATAADPYNGWDQTKCANYDNSRNVGISTWPVGSFPAGAGWCGARDLAGNVWEWCADWYGPYSTTPVTNPTGPATGDYRVLRGGSWGDDSPGFFRAAYRSGLVPLLQPVCFGFRCVVRSPGP